MNAEHVARLQQLAKVRLGLSVTHDEAAEVLKDAAFGRGSGALHELAAKVQREGEASSAPAGLAQSPRSDTSQPRTEVSYSKRIRWPLVISGAALVLIAAVVGINFSMNSASLRMQAMGDAAYGLAQVFDFETDVEPPGLSRYSVQPVIGWLLFLVGLVLLVLGLAWRKTVKHEYKAWRPFQSD